MQRKAVLYTFYPKCPNWIDFHKVHYTYQPCFVLLNRGLAVFTGAFLRVFVCSREPIPILAVCYANPYNSICRIDRTSPLFFAFFPRHFVPTTCQLRSTFADSHFQDIFHHKLPPTGKRTFYSSFHKQFSTPVITKPDSIKKNERKRKTLLSHPRNTLDWHCLDTEWLLSPNSWTHRAWIKFVLYVDIIPSAVHHATARAWMLWS